MTHYKPPDYSTVSPYLIVDGAAGTIDFLVTVLDGRTLRTFADENGRIMHAEVRLGDSVIMLADAPPGQTAFPAYVHVYVPDVDAAYDRALHYGATAVQAPVRKDDEDRRGGVLGPGGTTWWLATRVEDGSGAA